MTGKGWKLACMVCAVTIAMIAAGCASAIAQDYPTRPIRLIVPFVAGGSSDVLARSVAKAMEQGLGQTMIVDNRPGAGGTIGAEVVAHSPPDGYTVLFGTIGANGIGPALYKNLTYDPIKGFAPVGMLHELPNALIVNKSLPVTNLRELIAYAHSKPGQLTFASAGFGSISHLAAELFKAQANIDIVHVPYKGGGAAVPDLMSGRVSMMIETIPNALAMTHSGMVRMLAVTTTTRSAAVPDVPTFAESGLPDYDVSAWTGLFLPAGTPPAIVQRLNAETVRITHDQAYLDQLKTMGTDAVSDTPEAFAAFVRKEIANWTVAVERSGTHVE